MTLFIWEYLVKQESIEEFLRAYGPQGTWVELFSRAKGYLRTELHRDTANPRRFLTIDCWESEAAHLRFRQNFSKDYADIDESCAAFTESETFLGKFEPAGEIDLRE